MKLFVGTGKSDLTCFIPGTGMMGYGQDHNRVKEIATPLWARALVLKDELNHYFVLLHLEQAFVTLAIKEELVKRVQAKYPDKNFKDHNIAITAQHTHSAPGGYSHYPFYNFTIPNFQTKIFEKIIQASLEAIEEAFSKLQPASLKLGEHQIADNIEVAFNRSMKAQKNNPEAQYIKEEDKHLAIDRVMQGLEIRNSENKLIAFINWFGVHCTSISSFNQRIHHDNKGVAADLFEKKHPGCMAFFLQASAGDVSPNFVWDKKINRMRGKYEDQYENAAYNGELQFQEALKLTGQHKTEGEIESFHCYLDMAKVVAPPAHGVAFFAGTLEGPGVHPMVAKIAKGIARTVKTVKLIKDSNKHMAFYKAHGKKDILLDHRDGNFIGIPLKAWKSLPPIPEASVEAFRKTAKNNALTTLPWIPSILPFQLLRLNELVILFVPGEISVAAGNRLKEKVLDELSLVGIKKVILTSYANAYMGYIVTPEEYDEQCYEGGHTVYGRNTLGGIMQGFSYLCKLVRREELPDQLPQAPFHFPVEELKRRSS